MERSRLLAVVLVGSLLGVSGCKDDPPAPPVAGSAAAGRAGEAEARLGKVADALDAYLKKHMEYPDLLEVLIRDDLAKPADFDDPWGHRIDYTRKAAHAYRLCSRGPDNLPKTEDDVCLPGSPGER